MNVLWRLAACALIVVLPCGAAWAQLKSPDDIANALTPPPPQQERTRSMSINRGISSIEPQQAARPPSTDLAIEFEFGSANLTPRGRTQLDNLAQGVERVRTRSAAVHVMKLIGHTDAVGTDEANLDLSRRRAEAAREYLLKNFKFEANQFEVDWKGKRELKNPNNPAGGENRRVEIVNTMKSARN